MNKFLTLSLAPLLSVLLNASALADKAPPAGYLIFEDGAHEPLAPGLEFHHGSWKFADGAMLGEQVPTEKHTATIKGLMAFDQMKLEWKMKFLVPKENFLFVAWPAGSSAHAMDFKYTPDTGDFSLVRPKFQDKEAATLTKGKVTKLGAEWHEVVCIHDGANFTVTIDGTTITAADNSFTRPMGPFYLNGGGFDGAKFLVKDLKVSALPGSPQTRPVLPGDPAKSKAK